MRQQRVRDKNTRAPRNVPREVGGGRQDGTGGSSASDSGPDDNGGSGSHTVDVTNVMK
jgi:hypothetical protein